MNVKSFTFNPVSENTYILFDDTLEAVIIDPGCWNKQEEQQIINFIDSKKLNLKYCWLTHCHFDHMWGVNFIKNKYNLLPQFHINEKIVFDDTPKRLTMFGFPPISLPPTGTYLKENENLKFGNTTLEVLFTPGHSPGHLTFFHPESKQAIVGDVIFKQSIGRTDLPGGSLPVLMRSIFEKIIPLGPDVVLYPGHQSKTTVKDEVNHNPFLR